MQKLTNTWKRIKTFVTFHISKGASLRMASTLGSLFCTWMLGGSVAAAPWWPQIGLNFSTFYFCNNWHNKYAQRKAQPKSHTSPGLWLLHTVLMIRRRRQCRLFLASSISAALMTFLTPIGNFTTYCNLTWRGVEICEEASEKWKYFNLSTRPQSLVVV